MLLLLLLLLRESTAIDFRSQAYKSVESFAHLVPNGQQQSQFGNPYLQFTPVITQPPIYSGQSQQYSNNQANHPNPTVVNSNPATTQTFPGPTEFSQQPSVPSFPITELIQPNFTQIQQYNQQQSWSPQISQTSQYLQPVVFTTQPTTSATTTRFTYPTTTVTPMIWTTLATSKMPAKMSKLSVKPLKKEDGAAAHVSVPSHRLLNDILVIPSSRRLYVLAIIPIHESADNQGFECGRVDVNGFIRLAAFLDALNQVNNQRVLKDAGLSLGAVIVDSCSSDLRTVADLYELLSGTNIQKTDLVAMIRDDGSHLPNVDDFARHLKIPVINTFFTAREQLMTTGTLPSMGSPLEAMLGLLSHTESGCVSMLFDDLHEDSARQLTELSLDRGICIEQRLNLKGGGKAVAESAVRRMLLTEARIVIILLGENNWTELMKAFRSEMVIAGRFILLTTQDPRWFTSKHFTESWPHFDQLLLTVGPRKPPQASQLAALTSQFPKFPFPQHWLRQFWSTAFRCHIEGETENGGQFSKECSHKQTLNLTAVSPDIDIAPVTLAVYSVAHAMRKLVDNVCPGALVQSLNDCLNDPQESLFGAVLSLRFTHALAEGDVFFNESSGYRDAGMVINRVLFDSQLEVEPIGEWDTVTGFSYTAVNELVMEERDGSRVPLRSSCPRSSCASELARRSQAGVKPEFKDALNSAYLLIYAIGAVLAFFICMMCMYHQIVTARLDPYRMCTVFCFGGLSLLCLVSILFVMPPNAVSCAGRRIATSISLAAVLAPILVKTLAVWRVELTSPRRGPLRTPVRTSPIALFWICFGLVVIQAVIATEWSVFESPSEIAFASSSQRGHTWRCSPGDKFEQRLLNSCALCAFMILVSFICSILSVQHVESRQNILISIFAGLFGIGLYVGLPMMSYTLRDQIFAGALLTFSFLVLLITYCRGAFQRPEDDSSRGSLVDKSTMDRSEKNPYWLDNHVLSPRGHTLTLQRNYHQAGTLPQQMGTLEKLGVEGYIAPRIYSGQVQPRLGSMQGLNTIGLDPSGGGGMPRISNATLGRQQQHQHHQQQMQQQMQQNHQQILQNHQQNQPNHQQHRYGVDSYEPTPMSVHVPQMQSSMSTSKYGKQEFVLEEEGGNSRL